MYQYLLFDLDGTLTDSKEGIFNCIRHALDTLGTPVPPEQTLLKFIGPPLQDSFMEYCGFDREQAAEAVRIFAAGTVRLESLKIRRLRVWRSCAPG